MKGIILIVALILIAHGQYTCDLGSYAQYRTDFKKPALDPYSQKYYDRYQAFCDNVLLVTSQDPNAKFTFGFTERSDFLKDEGLMKSFTRPDGPGQPKQDLDNRKKASSNGYFRVAGATPKNWRADNKVTPVKNQGSCGSCWAFTTIALYEAFLLVKGKDTYDLSEQFILQCTDIFGNATRSSSCGGGYVDFSGKVVKNYGAKLESQYPYIAGGYTSSTGFPTTPGICTNVSSQFIFYDKLPNVKNITYLKRYDNTTNAQIQTLLEDGPVGALMYVPSTFSSYRSGVFSLCSPDFATSYALINHAVLIVGMDANKNYIIKNSWGTTWGDSGYGVIDATNDCAITAWVYALSWGYQIVGSTLLLFLGLIFALI